MRVIDEFAGVGARIRKYRRLSKVKQGLLASAVGMSVATWNRIEREEQGVEMDKLELMATALGIPVDTLLYDNSLDSENPGTTLGSRIRYYRLSHKDDLRVIADRANLSVMSWNRIEKDQQVPRDEVLDAIIAALGVTSDQIFGTTGAE